MTATLVDLRRLADEFSVGSAEEQERASFVRALTTACECADDYARVIRLVRDLQADIRNKLPTHPPPTPLAAEVESVEVILSPAVEAASMRRKRTREVVEDDEDREMISSKRVRFGQGPERYVEPPVELPVVPHRRRRILPDVERDVEQDVERDEDGIIVNFRESTVMQALRLVKERRGKGKKTKKIATEPHRESDATSSRLAWTEEERRGWAGALEKGKEATKYSEEVEEGVEVEVAVEVEVVEGGFALAEGCNLEYEEEYEPDTFDSYSICSVTGSVDDEDRVNARKAVGN